MFDFLTSVVRLFYQTLSALHDLELQPNKKSMHFALTAYAKNGDMRGVDDVIARMGSMGLSPTSTTINIVLRSIVNNDVMDWDAFTSCYFEHFGFQKFVADIDTYAVLLDACEKYDRPLDAAKWFKQMLAVDAYPTPPIRDTLHRILGDEDFEVFCSGLAPQYQYAMSIIDRKAELFPGKHSTASEESARLQRLGAKSPKIDISKSSSTPRAVSRDVAVKDVSTDASQRESISEPLVTLPKRLRSPRVAAQGSEVTSVTSSNASVVSATGSLPSMSSLLVLADRGDLKGLEGMIEELKVEGSVPLSLLMESLVYAHMKAFNTIAAQRVVDDMKFDNIDVSRQTFDYLMQAYSDDGNGPGTEMVASQALSMGFALGVSVCLSNTPSYSSNIFSCHYLAYHTTSLQLS